AVVAASTAHGHDAAAGSVDVAEPDVQDAGGADDLHAGGVLRPADRVHDGAGPLPARVGAEQLRHAPDLFGGAAAYLGHHLRRVACEVPPQNLHDAARVLQGRVPWLAGR